MTLHLIKLAVGVRDVEHLTAVQAPRLAMTGGGVRAVPVHTRQTPKRATDLLPGGSLYWVIRGSVAARQTLLDLESGTDSEGDPFCRIWVSAEVIPTRPLSHRPFQGWRYLVPEAAPPDQKAGDGSDLPPALQAELRDLGLL
ncbi:hypothetical protein M2352_003337 [Azospirillum fermentarium]|uniref:DUF1489 family protein n=1 Tax=Azospirillum fermentarium TaxID=1233114 RepID=UPI002226B35C|nr:DUF1489 domain-containing protein [Azospirillum fermentarium]MCW2247703.1 hypothetical protein [Azospirillum fermentarium]